MRSRGFKRALGSIVAASAAVVGLVVMTPATASAAPAILPPPVSVSAADNAITFTITNRTRGSASSTARWRSSMPGMSPT